MLSLENLNEGLMSYILPVFELFVFLLNIFSILILLIGVSHSLVYFFKMERPSFAKQKVIVTNNMIKSTLGSYILLSLEVLIAADIIQSIIKPTFEDILKLAALVVIRTVISYFLGKEIKEFSD